MSDYLSSQGVLLVNLGTPESPTPQAVKRFLSQFLSDKHVVDINRLFWYPLLYGIILPKRSPRIAKLYEKIWLPEGSPLMAYCQHLKDELKVIYQNQIEVELAMTYGEPSIAKGIKNLLEKGVKTITVLPLFPQYSRATNASIEDQIDKLVESKSIPNEIKINWIRGYAQSERYLSALLSCIQLAEEHWGKPDLLLFSFHGLPLRYIQQGDPYSQQCIQTTESIKKHLRTPLVMSYQSRFGREEWLQPYTVEFVKTLPERGIKHLHVMTPGFSMDCIETLSEIAVDIKATFLAAGGELFHYIPCLNATDDHVLLMDSLLTPFIKD